MVSLGRQWPELFAHWQTPLALKMVVFVYFVFSLNHISSPPILAGSALTVTVTNSSDADRETKPVTASSSQYPIAATSYDGILFASAFGGRWADARCFLCVYRLLLNFHHLAKTWWKHLLKRSRTGFLQNFTFSDKSLSWLFIFSKSQYIDIKHSMIWHHIAYNT